MIRQLGTHAGKRIVFGYDRHLLDELDQYIAVLSQYGIVLPAVAKKLHYLTSAERVCHLVQGEAEQVGVLICSTGMGMAIAANKFHDVYAARCLSAQDAQLSRSINNANVLCLAGQTGLVENAEIVSAFLTTPYSGRKLDELEYVAQLERNANARWHQPERSLASG